MEPLQIAYDLLVITIGLVKQDTIDRSLKQRATQTRSLFLFVRALLARVKDQLRTPKQRDRLPARLILHFRVPDLGSASAVEARSNAGNRSFTGSAEEVALELDGGEVVGAVGEVGEGAVAAGRVGESDDRRRVQVAVRGKQLGAQRETACEASAFITSKFDADQSREGSLATCVELVYGGHEVRV